MKRRADPVAIALERMRARTAESDPVEWARRKLGIELYSQQREICELVQNYTRVAVRSSHEIGKSFVAAVLACWWIDTHAIGTAYVITTAPSADQLKGVLWREINKIFDLAKSRYEAGLIDAPLPGRMIQTEWWIGNRRVGQGRKPADWDTDAFQGIHDEFVLAIIDEANGVPKPMWTGVEGVTSNDSSRVLAVGNPDDPESEFARVSEETNRIWVKKKVSAFDTPAFTGERVAPRLMRVLVGKNWVANRKEDWGENSPLYISRVLGEFPDLASSKQKVVPVAAVVASLSPPEFPNKMRRTPVELGMDVAASDEGDWTVLRERRGVFVGRTWKARTPEGDDAVDLAVTAAIETGATKIKVDEIGWGWGIVTAINREFRHRKMRCRAVGINVNKRAFQPDKFFNQRSELWWMVRDLLKDNAMILHGMTDEEATIAQLTDPNWEERAGGRIYVEAKDETRKRLGRSPDDADALILAFANPTGSGGVATVSRAGAKRKPAVRSAAASRAQHARRATTTRTSATRRRRGNLVARKG